MEFYNQTLRGDLNICGKYVKRWREPGMTGIPMTVPRGNYLTDHCLTLALHWPSCPREKPGVFVLPVPSSTIHPDTSTLLIFLNPLFPLPLPFDRPLPHSLLILPLPPIWGEPFMASQCWSGMYVVVSRGWSEGWSQGWREDRRAIFRAWSEHSC